MSFLVNVFHLLLVRIATLNQFTVITRVSLLTRVSMVNYPDDYPLWKDINFTPDWIYQRLQKRRSTQPSWLPTRYPDTPVLATPDKAWNEEEDALVIYAQSDEGKREGLNYKNVASALGRHLVLASVLEY